jgi:hypothetical protein
MCVAPHILTLGSAEGVSDQVLISAALPQGMSPRYT